MNETEVTQEKDIRFSKLVKNGSTSNALTLVSQDQNSKETEETTRSRVSPGKSGILGVKTTVEEEAVISPSWVNVLIAEEKGKNREFLLECSRHQQIY